MNVEVYSLYFESETYSKNSEFVNVTEETYKILKPRILSVLQTIYRSRHLYIPYNILLECTTHTIDIEKKLTIASMASTQVLTENGYDPVFIRTIIIDYEEYIDTEDDYTENKYITKNINDNTTDNVNNRDKNFSTNTNNDIIYTKNHTIPKINNKIAEGLCYFSGSVIRSSPIKPFLHFLTYKCMKCKQTYKKINDETKAKFCKCNKLELLLNEPKNIISDYREIKIKDNIDGIIWYNEPKLGDVIEGIGIVKMKNLGFGEYKKYLDIVFWKSTTELVKPRNDFLQVENDNNTDSCEDEIINFEYKPNNECNKTPNKTKNDKYFRELAKNENLLDKIAEVIFGDIYGYKNIKTALTLAFFGGSVFAQRSTIHVLLIGDPGLGKSKFLSIASTLLPKSVYTCSTTATSAGLTLSCNDNENINAGCVALCNDGICCIDEFDKLKDPRILYEVMENGTMTYNKGGMYYQINVNVTIIAASNPQGGTFGEDTNVKRNVKFENAMLNRFDLVFTMLEEFDENKMRKIIGLPDITDENKVSQASKNRITSYIQNKDKQDDNIIDDNHLDMDVIKQYIVHCRETISPVLSSKAKQRIKSYWLEQRKNNCTIQVLLTLKRLAEARAKINCREVASTKDADFAINLYKETKIITKKKGKFLDDLRERKGEVISKQQIEKMMNEYKVKQNIDCYIEKLNYQGIIIKKGKDQYKIT